jgi:hypothetical protein
MSSVETEKVKKKKKKKTKKKKKAREEKYINSGVDDDDVLTLQSCPDPVCWEWLVKGLYQGGM